MAISDISIIGGNYGISNLHSLPTISRNKIAGNDVGIWHWQSSSIISDNMISNNRLGIYTVAGASTIMQNTIIGNTEWGIWEQSGGSATIKDNIITGNSNGIHVDSSSSPIITENKITENVSNGIDVYVGFATIYRNTISANGGFSINAFASNIIVSFNVYDTIQVIGHDHSSSPPLGIAGMYNVKPDGSPVSLP